jgi:hypothetical protein
MRRRVVVAAGASLSACVTLIGVQEVGYGPGTGLDAGSEGASEGGDAADTSTGARICALLTDGGSPPDLGVRVSCGGEAGIDLSTDGRHCGECGHSCGEGVRCQSGQCLPSTVAVVLRDGGGYPILVAQDPERFYWVAFATGGSATGLDFGWVNRGDGSVVSFPVTGGFPQAAELTDEGLYVVSEGNVVLGTRDGPGPLPRVQDAAGLHGLAVGGPFVYFGAQSDVMRLSRDAAGDALGPPETLFQNGLGPSAAFAADAENVYFISPLGEVLRAPHGANYTKLAGKLPIDGSSQADIGYFMVAGPYLYWGARTSATLYRLLAGNTAGESELLAQAPGNAALTGMTFDDDWIYWAVAPNSTAATEFTLLKSPRCGGTTRVLGRYDTFEAADPKGVLGLAVDSKYLYYGTEAFEIRRIPK